MGKTTFAPFYLPSAWALIITYQLFTETAVTTVMSTINTLWSSDITIWLTFRIETIIFVHAFAWIFLLSSVIPSTILGQERRVVTQFLFCLGLSLGSIWIKDIFPFILENDLSDFIPKLTESFTNPLLAILFLSLPYVIMLTMDARSRMKEREIEKMVKKLETWKSKQKVNS